MGIIRYVRIIPNYISPKLDKLQTVGLLCSYQSELDLIPIDLNHLTRPFAFGDIAI